MNKGCVGIEIGTRQVKMVQWEDSGQYREETELLPDHYVCNGRVTAIEALGEFLKDMARKYSMTKPWCCLVLPDSVTYTRRLKMPAMTVRHLKLNLPYEFHDYIQNKREPYVFDYAVINLEYRHGQKPVSMDLMAAAAPRRVIEEYEKMLRIGGWKVKAAAPVTFAYSNLIREYEKGKGILAPEDYCFVDLGYHTTKIFFFHGNGLEAGRELEAGCEQLTWEDGPCRQLYETVGMAVRRTLEFYYFRFPDRKLKEIYFCGGGSRIEAFRETVAEYTGLDCRFAGELVLKTGFEKNDREIRILSPGAAGIAISDFQSGSKMLERLKERVGSWFI